VTLYPKDVMNSIRDEKPNFLFFVAAESRGRVTLS